MECFHMLRPRNLTTAPCSASATICKVGFNGKIQGSRSCGSGGLCQGGESVPSLDTGAGPPMVHLLCDSAIVAPVLNRGGAGSATSTDGLPS